MDAHLTCANCGINFCMPQHFIDQRRKDRRTFFCPNGHHNYFPGKTDEQKQIERQERRIGMLEDECSEIYAQREDLIGALKECPIPGCPYRSRKQISRSPVDMGRGIERVRRDLLEHLVRDHAGQASRDPLLLEAGAQL